MADNDKKPSAIARLTHILQQQFLLFHTPAGEPYAIWKRDPRPGTARVIGSGALGEALQAAYFGEYGQAVRPEDLRAVVDLAAAMAKHHGQQAEYHLRIAAHNGGCVIDLANAAGEVVAIAPGAVEVKPILCPFRRPRGLGSLPRPAGGEPADVQRLFEHIPVRREGDQRLVIAYLIAALMPGGTCPLLEFQGPQGSAKSMAMRRCISLIDPSAAPLQVTPRSERNLAIAARNSHLLTFDNLTKLHGHVSDMLCMISTGGGFRTRQLYTDDSEVVWTLRNPVMLTSIGGVLDQPDLLDRSIVIAMPFMPASQRRPEDELDAAWEADRPTIFSGMCQLLASVYAAMPTITLEQPERMADFCKVGEAVETVLGWPAGSFMDAYRENRCNAAAAQQRFNPLVEAVGQMMQGRDTWEGTATDLLKTLANLGLLGKNDRPGNGRAVSAKLRALTHGLAAAGVSVEFDIRTADSHRGIRLAATAATTCD